MRSGVGAVAVVTRRNFVLPPRPHAIDLDGQPPGQEDPDDHYRGQHGNAVRRLVDYDRPDDVGDDQDFEAQQDHPAEVLAEVRIRVRPPNIADVESARMYENTEPTKDENGHTGALDNLDDVLDVVVETHVNAPVRPAYCNGMTSVKANVVARTASCTVPVFGSVISSDVLEGGTCQRRRFIVELQRRPPETIPGGMLMDESHVPLHRTERQGHPAVAW